MTICLGFLTTIILAGLIVVVLYQRWKIDRAFLRTIWLISNRIDTLEKATGLRPVDAPPTLEEPK